MTLHFIFTERSSCIFFSAGAIGEPVDVSLSGVGSSISDSEGSYASYVECRGCFMVAQSSVGGSSQSLPTWEGQS